MTPPTSPRRVLAAVLVAAAHPRVHADLAFTSTVLAVRLNRACLVVVEERRAVVHDLSTLAVQRARDTPPAARGVVALASDPWRRPSPARRDGLGGVAAVARDCVNHHVACEVRARDSPIAALARRPTGACSRPRPRRSAVVRVHVLPVPPGCVRRCGNGAVPANV